jgi:hypothetical protein
MEGFDLNSDGTEFPNLSSYQEILRSFSTGRGLVTHIGSGGDHPLKGPESFALHEVQVQYLEVVVEVGAIADADFERCDNDENYMPIPTVYLSQENGDEEQDMNEFHVSIATALFNMRA